MSRDGTGPAAATWVVDVIRLVWELRQSCAQPAWCVPAVLCGRGRCSRTRASRCCWRRRHRPARSRATRAPDPLPAQGARRAGAGRAHQSGSLSPPATAAASLPRIHATLCCQHVDRAQAEQSRGHSPCARTSHHGPPGSQSWPAQQPYQYMSQRLPLSTCHSENAQRKGPGGGPKLRALRLPVCSRRARLLLLLPAPPAPHAVSRPRLCARAPDCLAV